MQVDVRSTSSAFSQRLERGSFIKVSVVGAAGGAGAAASNYIDVGDVRMQWGHAAVGGSQTLALPQPFADTNYSFVITGDTGVSNPPADNAHRDYIIGGKTTTTVRLEANNNTTIGFSWQAIGAVP